MREIAHQGELTMSRHSYINLLAIALAGLLSTAVRAQSFSLQPHLSTGVQDYKFVLDDAVNANAFGGHAFRDGFKVQDRISFVGAGLTATHDNLFLDISGQWNGKGKDQTQQFLAGSTPLGEFGNGQNHQLDGEFDRQELNATLGWGVTPNFSAYIGYKDATLDLSQKITPIAPPPGTCNVDLSLSNPLIGCDLLYSGTRRIKFSYQGFFVGATYSVPIKSWGALSLQSSVARLNATFKEHYSGDIGVCFNPFGNGCLLIVPIDPSFADNKAPVRGQSLGFNLGISWTGNFSWLAAGLSNLSYTIGVDRSQYAFDSGQQSDAFTAANFTETNTRARFELRYRFGT
jgi:hypothetical protein